jgi:hypothetical protein
MLRFATAPFHQPIQPKGEHMRLIAFPQWDKVTSLLRGMARQSAADYAQRNIVRIILENGVVHMC